jgi:glycosyltransferase involved in cell wall biosynthesis
MPVYNAERYLAEAMESILGQRYGDFEFLIFDDGSTDRSLEIIRSYQDPRIRLVRNQKNLGLVATLNRGLELARGAVVARMDADDVALPARLARQLALMEAEPAVVLLGSHVEVIDETGRRVTVWRFPASDILIRWTLLFECCFAHSAVMFRREAVRAAGGYTPGIGAEDYDLWVRLRSAGEFRQIPEALQRHRLRADGLYRRFSDRHHRQALSLMGTQAQELLGKSPPPERLAWLFQGTARCDPLPSAEAVERTGELVMRYLEAMTADERPSWTRRVLGRDAATRLFCLAAANVVSAPRPAARLAVQALQLSPRGLAHTRVLSSLRRGLRRFASSLSGAPGPF